MTGLKRRLAETEAQQRSQRDAKKTNEKRIPRDVDQIIRDVLKSYERKLTETKLTNHA